MPLETEWERRESMATIWWDVGFIEFIRVEKELSQERRAFGGRVGWDEDQVWVA